ncbi:MAG: hypothetical protein E5Y69_21200, partial [Mesorhizobium sp.]
EHHNMPGIASAATSVVIAHVAGTRTIRVGGAHDPGTGISSGRTSNSKCQSVLCTCLDARRLFNFLNLRPWRSLPTSLPSTGSPP